MKKITSLLLALIMMLTLLASCGTKTAVNNADTESDTSLSTESAPADTEEIKNDTSPLRVYALKGPTGMGAAKLMSDCEAGEALPCDFTIASSPDEITGTIIKGDFDVAAVPSNLAAVLYSKAPDTVRIAAVSVFSVLYILENGNTVNSIDDLEGKKIYATGQGSTPEYILRYILEKKGINCEIEYLTEHSELATKMISGDVVLGMLPVPNATTVLMKNADTRIAIDLGAEWDEIEKESSSPSTVIQGCVIVNAKTLETRKDDIDKILNAYSDSVTYIVTNQDEASELIEKYEIVPSAAIAKKALPTAGICFRRDDAIFDELMSFFKVLADYDAKAVGGSLPDDNIFYRMSDDLSGVVE